MLKRAVLKRKKPKVRKRLGLKKIRKSDLNKADSHFSDKIRKRDGKCMFPDCFITDFEKLTCSHYHSRAKFGTRFDEKNCIALCRNHHYWDKILGWEYQKQIKGEKGADWDGRYTLYMKTWLGEDGFRELAERAKITGKRTAIIRAYLSTFMPGFSEENLLL